MVEPTDSLTAGRSTPISPALFANCQSVQRFGVRPIVNVAGQIKKERQCRDDHACLSNLSENIWSNCR